MKPPDVNGGFHIMSTLINHGPYQAKEEVPLHAPDARHVLYDL